MSMTEKTTDKTICPHCGQKMKKWKTPSDSTWGSDFHWVCFNDECPYYVRGWKWMEQQYQQKASYRHSYNPNTEHQGPIPVWSPTALKPGIISEEEDESNVTERDSEA
jgi:hypothetical protein